MRRVQKIETAPAATAISLSEIKSHCGITISDDDTILGIYIAAATSLCEQILQRKLISQTWNMYLDYWPSHIELLFGDLQSVTHVKYTDIDEDQATFSADSYNVDTVSVPGRILLKDGETWPDSTLSATNPIEVQFITGYGDSSESIPEDIRSAVLLTTAHFYENRESYVVSEIGLASVQEIPWTANTLLNNHRVWRWIF